MVGDLLGVLLVRQMLYMFFCAIYIQYIRKFLTRKICVFGIFFVTLQREPIRTNKCKIV